MKILSMTLWCDCDYLTQLELVKTDYHAEMQEYQCPKCKRIIKLEFSLQATKEA